VTLTVWGFSDSAGGAASLPGPVIAANEGETLVINLHNDLPGETLALSFSGMDGWQPDLDGVAAGSVATYRLTLNQPGTYLYEAGMTPNGVKQIAMGLYGGLIVRPAGCATCAYAGRSFDTEALVVMSEIDTALHADPAAFRMENFKANYWLLNGKAYPQTLNVGGAPGAKVLVRYANAGTRHHAMNLLGLRQTVWGKDGIAEKYPASVVSEIIWPGQTEDVVVTIPASAPVGVKYALYEGGLLTHNKGQHVQNGGVTPFTGMVTFVEVTSGNAGPNAGPLAANVTVTPQRTTGAGGVTLSATFDDATTGGQNVTAAEWFVDTLGAEGTGTAFTVTSGVTVNVSATIDAATLATWTSSEHLLYVRGRDALGAWGAAGSTVLNLDYVGPDSTGLGVTPAFTNGTVAVSLTGTGDDSAHGSGTVISATYSINGGPRRSPRPRWRPCRRARTRSR
jgi:FtsP/CotA-like multicopper oxidase with cupredoxin domain